MKKLLLCLCALILFTAPSFATALDYSGLMSIAKDSFFQDRVRYALDVAALNVMGEDSGTLNHAQRVTLANQILKGDVNMFNISVEVLVFQSIAAEATATLTPIYSIPDADIQAAIYFFFNNIAGVSK